MIWIAFTGGAVVGTCFGVMVMGLVAAYTASRTYVGMTERVYIDPRPPTAPMSLGEHARNTVAAGDWIDC